MAPGRCTCGGWYQGNGICNNGVDGVDGVHKGPGWARRRVRRERPLAERPVEVVPSPRPTVPPRAWRFVIPCAQPTMWLVAGVRYGTRSTVPSCRTHLLNLLNEQVVQVEQVRRLPSQRARSVDSFFP